MKRLLLLLAFLFTAGTVCAQTPVTVNKQFRDGDYPNCVQAYINGSGVTTQNDVKNRYADGSLKEAIISYIDPSASAGTVDYISFEASTSCNNTGQESVANMLANYNFDAQIQLVGTVSHNISARTILSAASGCNAPTSDLDGYISGSGHLCTYWLQGPIVTGIILEDRYASTLAYDVNVDNGTGTPLHPRFEVWFYPSTSQFQVGYTLENDWASTTASHSARDQVYTSFALTVGNSSPTTVFNNFSTGFTQITRTMIHKTYCSTGVANNCFSALHVDHGFPYLEQTKLYPNWDPDLHLLPALIAVNGVSQPGQAGAGVLSNTTVQNLGGCGPTGGACAFNNAGGGANNGGLFYYGGNIDATGQDPNHGPLPTWDIDYFMTQCDTAVSTSATCGNGSSGDLYSVVMMSADLGGSVPYWFREYDTSAGHGGFFDAPNNTVSTQGRIISINARTNVNLEDSTSNIGMCTPSYTADWINYGGSGQDLGFWVSNVDTSHWPNIAYMAYQTSGQYAYYEQQLMQAGNAIGNSPGFTACTQSSLGDSAWRYGAKGYLTYGDGERSEWWALREMMFGATVAVDNSPEKAYFIDKMNANIAVLEGSHGLTCDVTGTGVAQPYCSPVTQAGSAYGWGTTTRGSLPFNGNALGSMTTGLCATGSPWTCYNSNSPICQTTVSPGYPPSGCTALTSTNGASNANFMNDYAGITMGMLNDLGFCPQTAGQCQLLAYMNNFFINIVEDPNSSAQGGVYFLGDYVYPTADINGHGLTTWGTNSPPTTYGFLDFFSVGILPHTQFGTGDPSYCGDEGYGAEGVANVSYAYGVISNEGYSGTTAYNVARPLILSGCATFSGGAGPQFNGANGGTPKWDITYRPLAAPFVQATTNIPTAPAPVVFAAVRQECSIIECVREVAERKVTER